MFVVAMGSVACLQRTTTQQLKLLSTLLLSKQYIGVCTVLKKEITIMESLFFSDLSVALYWIKGIKHE